ncbi:conserved hypothetical protein [Pediculus humanus corporis]|uniref:Prefoldin subunit 4 n=1 Tax=Pediculus humanus subsp. corporis TaxID=121224 RepID=E0VUB9_PEDHC|nr:uncharacterized protein Phum_PHUM449020 [Pediculus humanus corporis]EEB16975.1 conserved hypothetical protein [Pediculus humanus corporis]
MGDGTQTPCKNFQPNELKNLEDAMEELILCDESDGKLLLLMGEVFMCLTLKDTKKALEKNKQKIMADILELEELSEVLKLNMSTLKTELYGKFGNHINLEEDE